MPPTRARRVRGSMPIGESVPCGVISVTRSPSFTPSWLARSSPIRMAGGSSSLSCASASRLPCFIASLIAVTVGSSAGSIPFTLMNACESPAVTSALPKMVGAAPTTPGTCRSFSASGA